MICLHAYILISHSPSLEQHNTLHNDHGCHEDGEDEEDSPSGDQQKVREGLVVAGRFALVTCRKLLHASQDMRIVVCRYITHTHTC